MPPARSPCLLVARADTNVLADSEHEADPRQPSSLFFGACSMPTTVEHAGVKSARRIASTHGWKAVSRIVSLANRGWRLTSRHDVLAPSSSAAATRDEVSACHAGATILRTGQRGGTLMEGARGGRRVGGVPAPMATARMVGLSPSSRKCSRRGIGTGDQHGWVHQSAPLRHSG